MSTAKKRTASENNNLDEPIAKKQKLTGVDLICSVLDFSDNPCYESETGSPSIPQLYREIRTFAEECLAMKYSYNRFCQRYCTSDDGKEPLFQENKETFFLFKDVFSHAASPKVFNLVLSWFDDVHLKAIRDVMLIMTGRTPLETNEKVTKLLQVVKNPPPKITPAFEDICSHKTGSLPSKLSKKQITDRLGVEPDTEGSADGKVTSQWNFFVNGQPCAIWDYKGSKWSTFDPDNVLKLVFPEATKDEY